MSQSFDQIAAAIPLDALAGVVFQAGLAKKQKFPSGDDRAKAEWKRKLICRDNVTDRRYAHQERIQGVNIFICRLGEMIIGKCRVELPSFAIDALVHGATKRLFGPGPDPRFKVRRQIAGVNRAEWRRQCPATCIGHADIFCMQSLQLPMAASSSPRSIVFRLEMVWLDGAGLVAASSQQDRTSTLFGAN